MNLTLVGTSRCDVPAREAAGGIVAPLNAARTAQRAVPTRSGVQSAKIPVEFSRRSFLAGREGKTLSAFFMPNTIGRRPAATGSLRGYARVRKSNRRSLKLFDGLFHHRIGGGMDELRGP